MGMRLSPELTREVLELAAERPASPGISEKAFQAEVIRLAKRNGWKFYHTYDSRKCVAGFPDLLLVRGRVLVAAELKVGGNRTTAAQDSWLEAFAGVRVVESVVWRPEHWEEIGRTLAGDAED